MWPGLSITPAGSTAPVFGLIATEECLGPVAPTHTIAQPPARRTYDHAACTDVLVVIPVSTIQLGAAEFASRHYIQPVGDATSGCFIQQEGDPIGRLRKRPVGPVVAGSIAVRIKPSGCYLESPP